jgi:BMFP domain-containing protein YqiC
METGSIDRNQLKDILKEILDENPDYVKKVLTEIIEEKRTQVENRMSSIEKLIQEDFDKYDDVFKALA